MARYSTRERRWYGTREKRAALPNPYSAGSPHYVLRHRETTTELPNGLLRVDVGEPVK